MIKIKIFVDSKGRFKHAEVDKPTHIDFDLVVKEEEE